MSAAKLLVLALCLGQTNATNLRIDVADEPINGICALSNDGESSLYGFEVDDDVFDVNWVSRNINVSYNSVYCGTLRVDLGGVKMRGRLDNGYYAYGVLIRAIMSPKEFTLSSQGSTHTYRGRSRYLDITASVTSPQSLISAQPENVSGSSSYSIGFDAGGSSSGFSGSISASTTITEDALEILNTSSIIDGSFHVKYQYNRHIWPWEWQRTNYCWYDSTQRCSFFFSTPNEISSKTIHFEPTFAIDDGNIGMWNLEMGYEITASSSVTAYFNN